MQCYFVYLPKAIRLECWVDKEYFERMFSDVLYFNIFEEELFKEIYQHKPASFKLKFFENFDRR